MATINISNLLIFDLTETMVAILSPSDMGVPFYDAVHKDQLNKEISLTFNIPANNPKADFVVEGNLVAFKDLDGDYQLFEIKIIDEIHEDYITKVVYCENSYLELLDEFILYRYHANQTAGYQLSQALFNTRWAIGALTLGGLGTCEFNCINVVEAMNIIIDAFGGGEFKFRITISGPNITGRYVDLYQQLGSNTGKRFEYTKDVNSIKRTINASNIKTALYGFGKALETPGGKTRTDFSTVEWTIAGGDPRDKPLGQTYLEDPAALAIWGRASGTRHRWDYYDGGETTNPTDLLWLTNRALNLAISSNITFEMTIDDLERISGLTHEKVRLGDTVLVIDTTFRPKLRIQARVLEINRYLMEPEKDSVVIGQFKPLITNDAQTIRNLHTTVSSNSGVWQNSGYKNNMVVDHSFENLHTTGASDGNYVYSVDTTVPDYGSKYWWNFVGTGKIISTYSSTSGLQPTTQKTLYDYQAAVIKSTSIVNQWIPLNQSVGLSGPYTASCYVAAFMETPVNGYSYLELYAADATYNRLNGGVAVGRGKTFMFAAQPDVWQRNTITLTDPLPAGTKFIELLITGDFIGSPSLIYLADGVQLIPMTTPCTYEPESNVWKLLRKQPGTNMLDPTFMGDATVSGMITQGSPDYVRAWSNTVYTSVATVFLKIIFEIQDFDNRGDYVNTTGIFTCPLTGYYNINAMVRFTAVPLNNELLLSVFKNGANVEIISAITNSAVIDVGVSGNTVLKLTTGDTIEIYIYSSVNAVSTRVGTGNTHLSIMRLG